MATREFEFIELRRWEAPDIGTCDVLVADCVNDQVGARNAVGIHPRERLALVLPRDQTKQPQARALRADFPKVMHLNQVPSGEPPSLCLYFETWSSARRGWTAERFLLRILSWLADSSRGTLHRVDQPVEALYLDSPIDLVAPPEWQQRLAEGEKELIVAGIPRGEGRFTFRACVVPRAEAAKRKLVPTVAIPLTVAPVVHGGVEPYPGTLGELSDHLKARGADLLEPLRAAVVAAAGETGAARVPKQQCLLLMSVPTKRSEELAPERTDVRGFLASRELCQLGLEIGALWRDDRTQRCVAFGALGQSTEQAGVVWREIPLVPLAVRDSATTEFARRASAVAPDGALDKRILAGVGAVGSRLADIWTREGWGKWTLVDPDFVEAHNVVRHIVGDRAIGTAKVDAVKRELEAIYHPGTLEVERFAADILSPREDLVAAISSACLVVDATTTLEAPRELSRRSNVPRCASTFLTPSGNASVLLLEEVTRTVRLDELEAQYYGAILASDWGIDHLDGHNGKLWVGAGCRDISLVISNELVQLHGAILARQIRLLSTAAAPQIRVWTADPATSELRLREVQVRPPIHHVRGQWTVVAHEGITEKLKRFRSEGLPAETGGVVLGYIDHPLKRVFVVDILPAPADSLRSATGFVRGVSGLAEAVQRASDLTAGIVGYLGEWHSHPPFHRPALSGDDIHLLAHCAFTLARDGDPALMIIVGAGGETSYTLGARMTSPPTQIESTGEAMASPSDPTT